MEKQTKDAIIIRLDEQKEFLHINARFDEIKNNYLPFIEETKQRSARKVINKGYLLDVLPYENELRGDKLINKPLKDIQDDCCVYYFDEQDRVILIEKPKYNEYHKIYYSYHTFYTYQDTYIEKIYGDYTEPIRIQHAFLVEGKVTVLITNYCKKEYGNDLYRYEGNKLTHIEDYTDWNATGEFAPRGTYEFMYGEKGMLTHILFHWANGGSQYSYSTSKVNYKQLEERLKEQLNTIFGNFLKEHPDETFTRLGIECGTGHVPSHMLLNLDTETDKAILEKTVESGEDWEYFDIGEVPLFNFPLDNSQEEKTLQTIAKVLISLKETDWLQTLLTTYKDFKIVFTNHHGEVAEDYPRIRKLLKDPVFDLTYQ